MIIQPLTHHLMLNTESGRLPSRPSTTPPQNGLFANGSLVGLMELLTGVNSPSSPNPDPTMVLSLISVILWSLFVNPTRQLMALTQSFNCSTPSPVPMEFRYHHLLPPPPSPPHSHLMLLPSLLHHPTTPGVDDLKHRLLKDERTSSTPSLSQHPASLLM